MPRIDSRRYEGSNELIEAFPSLSMRAGRTQGGKGSSDRSLLHRQRKAPAQFPVHDLQIVWRQRAIDQTHESAGIRGNAAVYLLDRTPAANHPLTQPDRLTVNAAIGLHSGTDVDDDFVAGELW